MRGLIVGFLALTAFVAVGCQESYKPVNQSEPPQVVVRDSGDNVDNENIEKACVKAYGPDFSYDSFKWAGDDETTALVTCKEEK